MIATRLRHAICAVFLMVGIQTGAYAESWPPLNPPTPMTVEWVVSKVLTRYPEVHAKYRAYLAALEAIPVAKGLAKPLAERDADLVYLAALEHHLDVQSQAQYAYYDYWLADYAVALIDNQRRLLGAYQPALEARAHAQAVPRDFAVELARLHILFIKATQDRYNAALRLNTLLSRHVEAPLSTPSLGDPLPPANRDESIKQALKNGIPMRVANAQIERAVATVELARHGKQERTAAAASHTLGQWQEQRRAHGGGIVRDVNTLYHAAHSKLEGLKQYRQEILPRLERGFDNAMTAYQQGRVDATVLIDASQAHMNAELEALQWRADYEKTLADLNRTVGILPPYAKMMTDKPLNSPRDPNAQ